MTKPINARRAGHTYERDLVKEWKELGWTEAATSRYESRTLDDQKVDLVNTDPYQIQAKRTARAPNFHELLDSMPKNGKTNVVFHKRVHCGETVTMRKADFYRMVLALRREQACPICDQKKPLTSAGCCNDCYA